MLSILNLNLSLSKDFLKKKLNEVLNNQFQDLEMETNGVQVKIKLISSIDFKIHQQKVDLYLPLQIMLQRPSGLFSMEGEGSVNLHLSTTLQVDKSHRLISSTELMDHSWVEKPTLKLGVLSMPVETLINLIINHFETIIIGKIDNGFKENVNLKEIIAKFIYTPLENLVANQLSALTLDLNILKCELHQFKTTEDTFIVDAFLHYELTLGQKDGPASYPTFHFNTPKTGQYSSVVNNVLAYSYLEKLAMERMTGIDVGGKPLKISSLKISKRGTQLIILGGLSSPAEVDFKIAGVPQIDKEEQEINFLLDDLLIQPSNFIYKMAKPLIEGWVKAKVEEIFPFDLNSLLADIKSKLPFKFEVGGINHRVNIENIYIEDAAFQQDDILVKFALINPQLTISDSLEV